jgi:hypothetical protein
MTYIKNVLIYNKNMHEYYSDNMHEYYICLHFDEIYLKYNEMYKNLQKISNLFNGFGKSRKSRKRKSRKRSCKRKSRKRKSRKRIN